MDPQDLAARVRQIQLVAERLVDEIFVGDYHSAFKGVGMEFDEVRDYRSGDDIRAIDWNVTARKGALHVKKFCEERQLTLLLLADISASMEFGTQRSKKEAMIELIATLASAATKNNDNVGLLLFADHVEKFLEPRRGKKNVLRIIRELLVQRPLCRGGDPSSALRYVLRTRFRHAMIFLFSDRIDMRCEQTLRQLGKRFDVIAVPVVDPAEYDLPDVGLVEWEDIENHSRMIVDTSASYVRRTFNILQNQERSKRRAMLQRIHIDELELSTDRPYLKDILLLLRRRRRRLGR